MGNQPHAETPKTKLKYITYINVVMMETVNYVLEWEGKADHEYRIARPFKWVEVFHKDRAPEREVDETYVYYRENGRSEELTHDTIPIERSEETVESHIWSLRPGKTYLVVRVKKELNEPSYHIMAYCYKVNEDGTAIKKQVADQYAYPYLAARNYVSDLRNRINCEEYFK